MGDEISKMFPDERRQRLGKVTQSPYFLSGGAQIVQVIQHHSSPEVRGGS